MTQVPDVSPDDLRAAMVDGIAARYEALGLVLPGDVRRALLTVPRHLFTGDDADPRAAYADQPVVTKRDDRGVSLSSVSAPSLQAMMIGQARVAPGTQVLTNSVPVADLTASDKPRPRPRRRDGTHMVVAATLQLRHGCHNHVGLPRGTVQITARSGPCRAARADNSKKRSAGRGPWSPARGPWSPARGRRPADRGAAGPRA